MSFRGQSPVHFAADAPVTGSVDRRVAHVMLEPRHDLVAAHIRLSRRILAADPHHTPRFSETHKRRRHPSSAGK